MSERRAIAVVVLLLTFGGVSAALLWNSDFEAGTLAPWPIADYCCSYSAFTVTSPVRTGTYGARFELRRTDPDVANSKRAELSQNCCDSAFQDRWYGFSIYLPTTWETDVNSAEIVTQWHNFPDPGEMWTSPPLALLSKNGRWLVDINWDPASITTTNPPQPPGGNETIDLGPYTLGAWTDWVFHVNWSYREDGILEVWRNGSRVVSRYGSNMFNDGNGVYMKIGIYKWDWKSNPSRSTVNTRIMYGDQVKIGDANSSYAEVAPINCVTVSSGAVYANRTLPVQSGIFTFETDVTPSTSTIDNVVALSSGAQSTATGFACLARFNASGFIDARNGGAYGASSIPYSANNTYHLRMVVNVPSHTYSVYVTPPGGSEQTVGLNYAFRTEQNSVLSLNNWGTAVYATSGTSRACGAKCGTSSVIAAAAAGFQNRSFVNRTGAFTAEFDAVASNDTLDAVMALSSGAQSAYTGFACLIRFNAAGYIDARNGGAYGSSTIGYDAYVKYHFRMVINVVNHTYSVYVTRAGGPEQTVALNYSFRTEQLSVTNLDNLGVNVAGPSGTNRVSNFVVY